MENSKTSKEEFLNDQNEIKDSINIETANEGNDKKKVLDDTFGKIKNDSTKKFSLNKEMEKKMENSFKEIKTNGDQRRTTYSVKYNRKNEEFEIPDRKTNGSGKNRFSAFTQKKSSLEQIDLLNETIEDNTIDSFPEEILDFDNFENQRNIRIKRFKMQNKVSFKNGIATNLALIEKLNNPLYCVNKVKTVKFELNKRRLTIHELNKNPSLSKHH